MLGLTKLIQALFTQFTAHTAHLKTAERPGIVISQRIVDPERSCLHLFEEPFGFDGIVGVEVGTQSILAIVGKSNGLVKATIGHDRNDWPKGLLAHDCHRVIDIGHNGWLVEVAAFQVWRTSSTYQNLCSTNPGFSHLILNFAAVLLSNDR